MLFDLENTINMQKKSRFWKITLSNNLVRDSETLWCTSWYI